MPAIVKPDLTLLDSTGRPVAVVKTRLRNNLRTYDSDYASLMLASYLIEQQENVAPSMIVVVSKDPGELLDALNHLVENGPIPVKKEKWIISSRVYDRSLVENFLLSAVKLLRSSIPPTPSPSDSKCSKCPFRNECPALGN